MSCWDHHDKFNFYPKPVQCWRHTDFKGILCYGFPRLVVTFLTRPGSARGLWSRASQAARSPGVSCECLVESRLLRPPKAVNAFETVNFPERRTPLLEELKRTLRKKRPQTKEGFPPFFEIRRWRVHPRLLVDDVLGVFWFRRACRRLLWNSQSQILISRLGT